MRSRPPRWVSTAEQVVAQIRTFSLAFGGAAANYQLVQVPIDRIEFDDMPTDKDVIELAAIMKKGAPIPPATGFADGTWFGPTDALYGVTDGNHRISAAKLVGLKTVPMIIPVRKNPYRKPSPPSGPPLLSLWSVLKSILRDERPAFHGTRSADTILANGLRPSTGGEFGPGIYLTQNVGAAAFYAEHVARGPGAPEILELNVVLKNPYRVAKTDWIKLTQRSTPMTVQRRLIKQGYDSIIGIGINGHDEQIVAWYPEQIVPGSIRLHTRSNPTLMDWWT